MILIIITLLPILVFLKHVVAQGGQACNSTNLCPSSAPCCSEFGFCGDGVFCLGGCNPLASHSLTSCMPNPVCQDANHTFIDNSRILSNATYFDGNASEYDWVVDKGNIMNTNSSGGELALLLTETNGGTRISSTRYVHFGTVTAKIKTGHWNGVVMAFITMSNIKDEIDWEFPSNQTTQGQTNFFWQGLIPPQTAGETEKDLSDTFADYHEYTIDWKPQTLSFLIDGMNVRTIQASDYTADGVSRYPNTPSRIQLSLWPAGINGTAPGTVQWAGGMINWNDPDYASAGHFYALVSSVSVKCADPQPISPDITSYVYVANTTTLTPGIALSNQSITNGASTFGHVDINSRGALAVVVGLLLILGII